MNLRINILLSSQGADVRQKLLPIVLILSLLLIPLPTYAADSYQDDFLFEECDSIEADSLRTELNEIAQQVFADGSSDISIRSIINTKWQVLGMDATLDREVDKAVERVRGEEDYFSRFLSGWSSDKAKELTEKVAGYTFGSDTFKEKVDELALVIAGEIAAEMESLSARSASSGLVCLEKFIGGRYSGTMASVFQQHLEKSIQNEIGDVDFESIEGDISFLETHSSALAGVGVIVATQIAKRLATRLSQRIAGKIVGRILGRAAASVIPVAGWVIGAGLIVWDLIEGGNGALPQIQEALKGPDVKSGIQDEIVLAVEPELAREFPIVAREVANGVYSTWLEFRQNYNQVLALADENSAFKTVLESTTVDDIFKLSSLVAITKESLGREQLSQAIESGSLERALYLPESSYQIIQNNQSLDDAIAWAGFSGDRVDEIVDYEIYKLKSPTDFNRQSLNAILDLGDMATISKILLLDKETVDVLLTLPTNHLTALAGNSFSNDDLIWLSGYLTQLDQRSRNQLVARLLDNPKVMAQLKNENLKETIVEQAEQAKEEGVSLRETSEKIEETIDFVSTPNDNPGNLLADVTKLLTGAIPFSLFLYKYGVMDVVIGVAILLLIVALIIWLIFRRRQSSQPTIIVNMPSGGGGSGSGIEK